MCWCSCCWEKEVRGWGENVLRCKGGCSGVRSAMSEPGRIPRSPTLRSIGNEAAHDTGTATVQSGKGRRAESQLSSPQKKKNTFTYTKHRRKQYLKGGQCKQTQVNHCLEKGWLIYTAITHTRSTTNPSAKIEPLSQAVGKVTIYMYIQSTSRVGKRAKNKNTVAGYSFQDNIRDALCSSLKGKRNWTLVFSI